MNLIWMIIVGAIAGFVARFLSPAPNNPQGFLLTTLLGIVGSVVATFLGQALHLYRPGQSARLIGSIVGAVIVLIIWRALIRNTYSA
jgi:uncharacterized membrane protein YeaQ/YmgE (transglycosylase-associated protein family)